MLAAQTWDEKYATDEYYYGTEPNIYLKEKLIKYHPGLLLLPGEGEGHNAVFAASMGCDVYAFDQSQIAREKALRLAANQNLRLDYKINDVVDATYPSHYFQMIGLFYLHMPPQIRKVAHRRLLNFLEPEGYLVLEAFHKKHLGYSWGPRDISLLYDENLLKEDFRDLEIIELYTAQLVLTEGKGHFGPATVVRLTAQKNRNT